MTKRSSTPADAVLVAIDMSKHRQEVLIERPEGGGRRRMTIMATKADYDRLADELSSIGRPIVVGFEATGNYHRTLAHRLLSAGFALRLISSVALARTREALHNGWDKNDSKDAQVILHMLRIGATQRYVDPLAAGINDLQEMSKTHEAISKAKTQTWHRILTHYLPLYFPEIERFAGNSRSDWFLALLERFPTPTSMTALGPEDFTREAWPLVGRKVSKARLINDIYETACASVALLEPCAALLGDPARGGSSARALVSAFFSGSLLIETLFSLDGLGLLSYESVVRRDYPVVLGSLFLFTLIGLIVKLLSDLLYTLVDPRVQFGAAAR